MSATEMLKTINDKRQTAWAAAQAILDAAEARDGSMTAEEDQRFLAASADMDALKVRADAIVAAERTNREMNETMERVLGPAGKGNPEARGGAVAEAAELRKFATNLRRGGASEFDLAPSQGAVRRAREAQRTGRSLAEIEARDLVVGTTTAGGYLVPTTLYGQLVQHLVASSAILTAGATVLETAGANNIDVPITTSHGAAALVTEGAGIAESDAAFSKRTLGGYKYGQLIQISRELLDDELFDIIPYVAEAGGRNVGLALGSDLLVGNGSSKPSGILQTSTLGATGGTGVVGVPTADNLIDLMFSVIAPYRASSACAWLVKDSTLGPIRKLKDTAGRYLFDPGFNGAATVGAVDSLLGKPIYTDPYVPATGLGLKSVIFGDISRYFARIAGGIRFERSDEYAFNADLVTFKVVIRGDGVLVDQTGGVKHFIGGAS